ncbi:MAG: aminotransferase class I/II-fold pyridoxal phosphate-dependent enzyme [Candidatus Diapherotrites archaeon]|nr:aminotransferase class I/II-fold pyridoxal phosphate-dependent enzyme [Candidatus Diapherotrites archaeon]
MKKVLFAQRMSHVRHALRDVVPIAEEVEKSGKKVLHLNIGDPMVYDYRTPKHIWNAIFENKKVSEGYSNAIGTVGARKAVADYAKRTGVPNISMDDVVTFVGGSESIINFLSALLNPGENILTPCPGYSLYTGQINFLGADLNEYYLDEENNWQPDLEGLEKKINNKTRAIVVINPNNPTGGNYSKSTLKKIIDIAGSHELPVFSDETYDQLVFDDEKFYPLAFLSKDVPVICSGSISKNYLCPGLRGGWLYKRDQQGVLEDFFEAVKQLSRLRLSTVHPTQFAIEAALNGPQDHFKELVTKLQKRRDATFKRANEIKGLSLVKPKGAFYAYVRINLPIKSDKEFVLELLRQKGVLVVYGEGFGQKSGTHHFRTVFLPNEQTINFAFDKIEEFIKEKFL